MKNFFAILFFCFLVITGTHAQIPSQRNGHSVVTMIDPVTGTEAQYIFGGYNGDYVTRLNDLFKYDPNAKTFSKIEYSGNIPIMRDHNAHVYNGKMYIFNGYRNDHNDTRIYIYDPVTNAWSSLENSPMAKSMAKTSISHSYKKLFFSGGIKTDNTLSNECWSYDPSTNQWTQETNINMGGRSGAASFTADDKLYLLGGNTDNGISGALLVYDLINKYWSMSSVFGSFIACFDAVIPFNILDCIFIWGGLTTGSNILKLSDVVISNSLFKISYDTVSGQVLSSELRNDLPPLANGAAWIDVTNGDTTMYAFGGISNISSSGDTTVTNNFYRYNITVDTIQQYDTITQSWGTIISSINETNFSTSEELKIFPNPASEATYLQLANHQIIETVKIFNENGQLIRIIKNQTENLIQINDLRPGLFFVRVDTDDRFYLGKIIKK